MSELKATTVYDAYWTANSVGEGTGIQVYLKSEADKVIAELKDRLQNVSEILKETRGWLMESQKLHKRCADNATKMVRHSNHKRCLAMADMCQEAICYWDNVKYTYFKGEAYCFRKLKHYGRWGQIWLAIAEKFKEAK